ncbi:MAG: glycosyltransferase family 2 protein [Pseudomonadota bacterium]
MLTALILAHDEALHIERAIQSINGIAARIVVVDSGSTDGTRDLARALGAEVLHHPWVNHSTQFNWGLDQLPADTEWVLRLDADEVVTSELSGEIAANLPTLGAEIVGAYVSRRMTFMGRPIRYGGVFPVRVLRLFRHGEARCERRWMDEHIVADGLTTELHGEIIDDNLNSLTWWTQKHNAYASREVVDLLNLEHGFLPFETVADLKGGGQAGLKRWIKETVYARLPLGARAFFYFIYRYFIRLGFLDGKEGAAFHVLQGLWYRYLVDMKLHEVQEYMRRNGVDAPEAIAQVLAISVAIDTSFADKDATAGANEIPNVFTG